MKCSVCSLTEEPDMGSVLVYLEKIKTICVCKFGLFFYTKIVVYFLFLNFSFFQENGITKSRIKIRKRTS